MRFLEKIDQGLARFEGWLVVFFLGSMVLFTFIQVCLRGLYTHARMAWASQLLGAVDWSEPLARLLVLWLSLVGASLVTGENRHIRIDFLSGLVPRNWEPLRDIILSIICAGISGIMAVVSMAYVSIEIRFGGLMFSVIPNWVGLLILPLGFSSICFRFTLRSVRAACRMRLGEVP